MLYKRPNSKYWYVKLKHRGRHIRKSTGCTTKRDASRVEEALRKQLQAIRRDSVHTFGDAALRWLDEKQHKRSLHTDVLILEWLRPRIEHLLLSEITRDVVDALRKEKLKECSESTVNRHMALLRAILKKAQEDWEWVDRVPKVPMYPTKKSPPRCLSWQQFLSLEAQLPTHLVGPAWFAVSTGLRSRAIRLLRWGWISRDGIRFPPEVMKNNQWLTIPLSMTAWYVLAEQGRLAGCDLAGNVFVTPAGKPWAEKFTTRAWRQATTRAGLTGVRFHDLRHTWASWHAQKGTPMEVIQKLGGWSTYEAMQIYAHHSPTSLQEWV